MIGLRPLLNNCLLDYFPYLAILTSFVKILLIPSYRSTDFDVHRNWLGITYSLPRDKWYYEETSIWTLDYPPLFAWFQYLMSIPASFIDPKLVMISKDPVAGASIIMFMRLSVIVSDIVYYYACYETLKYLNGDLTYCMKKMGHYFSFSTTESDVRSHDVPFYCPQVFFSPNNMVTIFMLFNPGLIIIDHMHFQYNGLLLGLFLLSIVRVMEGRIFMGSAVFAILLNMKHIFLYASPAFLFFLLRRYCFDRHYNFKPMILIKLAIVVTVVFTLSIGPFISHWRQLLIRLFPFKRGLTHSYWAPNVWSLYNFLDLLLAKVFRLPTPGYTSGIVSSFDHAVLPNIHPLVTMILTIISIIPCLYVMWSKCHMTMTDHSFFLRSVIICSLSSFLFGWHVHEKAILITLIPLTPLAIMHSVHLTSFFILSFLAPISLFPLILDVADSPTKYLLFSFYFIYVSYGIRHLKQCGQLGQEESEEEVDQVPPKPLIVNDLEGCYLFGLFIWIFSYCSLFHHHLHRDMYPFLPLAITSVYCAIGIIYTYIQMYAHIFKVRD